MEQKAVVCGAGGFIGSHLVRALTAKGRWVRGVDVVLPHYSPTAADEFLLLDLRDPAAAGAAVDGGCDVVFQLAADMGGMGFISDAECEVLGNNALTDLNVVHAAAVAGVDRYFFGSSVCFYRDMEPGEPELVESRPDDRFGRRQADRRPPRARTGRSAVAQFQPRCDRVVGLAGPRFTEQPPGRDLPQDRRTGLAPSGCRRAFATSGASP